MFENKKYITYQTLEKLHKSGIITGYTLTTKTHTQHFGSRGQTAVLNFEPVVLITVKDKNGDTTELTCDKKRRTFKIRVICVNNFVVQRRG